MESSEFDRLPPRVRERLSRLQQLQETLRTLMLQRQGLELELSETERALKELTEIPSDTAVYKSIGAFLVKKDKESIVEELNERKELLSMRIKVLGRQEEKTKARVKELQGLLQRDLGLRASTKP